MEPKEENNMEYEEPKIELEIPVEETEQTASLEDAAEKKQDEQSEWETKYNQYLDKYQRTLAEFDNFRKRTMKEKASMYQDGARDTVLKLLPVVDNLERAVDTKKEDQAQEDSFYTGVSMTLKQLKETLKTLGVEEIPALGEKFNPNLHSAVAHEDNEEFGENEISFVMLKGYTHNEKVIRPSMVKVAN